MNETSPSLTFQAIAGVGRPLVEAISALFGLGVLAYLIGWHKTSAYYKELGAPWVTEIVGSTKLAQASISIVGAILLFAFMSVCSLAMSVATHKNMRRGAIGTLTFGFLFWIGSYGEFFSISLKNQATLLWFSGYFFAISAGLTLGEIVARYKEYGLRWDGYYLFLLCFVMYQAFVWAPSNMGKADALRLFDGYSSLPFVELEENKGWQLLEVTESAAVLLLTGTNPKDNLYKLVPLSDLKSITSNLQKVKKQN